MSGKNGSDAAERINIRARGGRARQEAADRQAPAPRARRAAPSHGRRPHAAALALHRRCACDIAPHPPGNTPESARLRAPCVRCVHARRGLRSGEAGRLCVLRACVSLPIRVRPGAGEANEAQGPTTHITTNTNPRAYARARGGLPRSSPASPEQTRRTSPAASHLEGGRGEAEERRQLQPPPSFFIIM